MTKEITHLKRFCESLQTQLRMVQAEAMKGSRPPVSSPTLSEEGGGGGGGVKKFDILTRAAWMERELDSCLILCPSHPSFPMHLY